MIEIAGHPSGADHPAFGIAEMSGNHNRSPRAGVRSRRVGWPKEN